MEILRLQGCNPEQAIREIYLKPFQITGVLRNEWGFNGTVITDYDGGGAMDTEQCVRAGGDLKQDGAGAEIGRGGL